MYKSKTGRLIEEKEDKLRNRRDKRQTLFLQNRVIDKTPAKVIQNGASTTDEGIGSMEVDESMNLVISQPNVSRQQAFRKKFKQYLEKKAAEKLKKEKLKPFLSAVATGRFIDTAKQAKKVESKQAKQLEVPLCETPKFSPINTRSRKLALLSPSRLPTPKRKSRSRSAATKKAGAVKKTTGAIRKVDKPTIVSKNAMKVSIPKVENRVIVKKIVQTKPLSKKASPKLVATKTRPVVPKPVVEKAVIAKPVIRRNPTTATITTAKSKASNVVAKPVVARAVIAKPVIRRQPTIANEPTTSSASHVAGKPVASKAVIAKPVIRRQPTTATSKTAPAKSTALNGPKFNFAPYSDLITSTVVKLPRKSTQRMFNESISPIEETSSNTMEPNGPVSKNTSLRRSSKLSSSAFNSSPFVSPFVKIKSKIANRVNDNPTVNALTQKPAENLNETPVNMESAACLNYVSPYVTISRGGRNSSRKEKEARNTKYALESRKSLDLNDSVENRQYKEAAAYFRLQVQRETDLFNVLMDKWRKYQEETRETIPSEYVDLINVAIGQTQLLTTSKFKQFQKLVDQCENGTGEQPVKPEDLEGFWSMVYIQVENCNARFQRLEVLKENNWEDPELRVVKEKKIIKDKAMVAKAKPAKKRINSALAAMLKEARQKYTESKQNAKNTSTNESIVIVTNRRLSVLNKSKVSTPRRTMTPLKTPWTVSHSLIYLFRLINSSKIIHPLFFYFLFKVQETMPDTTKTPVRSILKTPGSIRKTRMTLTFKRSPMIKLFDKENASTDSI